MLESVTTGSKLVVTRLLPTRDVDRIVLNTERVSVTTTSQLESERPHNQQEDCSGENADQREYEEWGECGDDCDTAKDDREADGSETAECCDTKNRKPTSETVSDGGAD